MDGDESSTEEPARLEGWSIESVDNCYATDLEQREFR